MMPGTTADRTYLYVPPEEKAEVEALGARWDDKSKCWYIGSDQCTAGFSQWLPGATADEEFTITSDRAHVASTTVACWNCHAQIEAICIYCERGVASDEPLIQFTVSHVWAMDSALVEQLKPWPFFVKLEEEGSFANHCPHCNAVQDDMYLHSEPDQPFFSILNAPPGTIEFPPLVGRIQLSGDESFEV